MVASISALTSSAQAASYYEADDYYAEGGLAPSEWHGEGAKELGLDGNVDRDQFRTLLDGNVDGTQLGRKKGDEIEHRPGWDITMSAPKSVSIMAEVAGDRRLITAHEKAVKVALDMVESQLSATRIRQDGAVNREKTDNLIIASFQHGTSRAQDPQIHTHNVILNATRDDKGNWRSLEPRALYQKQKQIGAIYRQELAFQVRSLGYDIISSKDSTFEIAGISPKAIEALSSRSSAIEERLNERGKNRSTSSAAEKQIAALDTRESKEYSDQKSLVKSWRESADENDFGMEARLTLLSKAKEAAKQYNAKDYAIQHSANQALAQAMQSLSERQSVFSQVDLIETAGRFSMGTSGHKEIITAQNEASESGVLHARTWRDKRGARFDGFATQDNIALEEKLLALEAQGRSTAQPIASPMQAALAIARAEDVSKQSGHAWNEDQRLAAKTLLTSNHSVTALQGYAGTAKTTTVLAVIAKEAEHQDVKVTAIAPTASAALVLGDALHVRGVTAASHLQTRNTQGKHRAIWIIDEASLLSTRDTVKIFEKAQNQNANIILVGDTKQLGSVEAGSAFDQLQKAGMKTAHLKDILRQTNAATKEAVFAAIEGDAKKALSSLENGGGNIYEAEDRETRFTAMANDYAKLDERTRKNTLIIEPSREGRDTLTAEIRSQLSKTGALEGETFKSTALASKALTRAEAKDVLNYDQNDVIIFTKNYHDKNIKRSAAYIIEQVHADKSAITLLSENGDIIDWRLKQWGASNAQAYEARPIELQKGDQIQLTRNDHTLSRINGQRGQIEAIDPETRIAAIKFDNGNTQQLHLDRPQDQHIRHGYVETAFAAQGRTAQQVMIHADSAAANLVDQKSFYVALSRAKEKATIYTNDKQKLISAIQERTGERQVSLEVQRVEPRKSINFGIIFEK